MTETKALTPAQELNKNLVGMKPQFKAALPAQIDADKFVRIAQTAIASNKALLDANRTSLYAACMKAAQDGLLPDGREAALVTFGQQVQYMPMIGGILKKIRNSGELATITSQIIHKNDTFEYYIDQDGEHFRHQPNFFGDRGDEIGAYALARTKDGAIYIEVMTAAEIEAVRKVSRSGNSGPWNGPFKLEMWKKTVTRRLSKRLPSSSDLDMTFKNDDEDYEFEQPAQAAPTETTVVDESKKPAGKKTGNLKVTDLMKAAKNEKPAEVVEVAEVIEADLPGDYVEDPPVVEAEELPI